MYVTIIIDGDDAVAYGPHPDPEPAQTPAARHVTMRLCPPTLLERSTQVVGEPKAVADLEPETARVLVEIARQRRHHARGQYVIGVVFHPGNRLAMAVGPLTRAEAARWWSSRRNRLPGGGSVIAVITLTTPTTSRGEESR